MTLSHQSHAIAFRLWQHCAPLEWDCSLQDAADALGMSVRRVKAIAQLKGWLSRFRANARSQGDAAEFVALNIHSGEVSATALREVDEVRGLRFAGVDE